MCNHLFAARQPMAFGASYLCDRCGAQLNRLWDVKQYPEDVADDMGIVEDAIMEVVEVHIENIDYPY
jgi:hypothetical protein